MISNKRIPDIYGVLEGVNLLKKKIPKYTQIGNAVPPLLAKYIGERIKQILPKV